MDRPIYLDYNATTPIDPAVLDAMMLFLKEAHGNASSITHSYGWEACQAVDKARQQTAELIGCSAKNIIWTSGATESNNLALLSFIRAFISKGETPHLVTSMVEHKAVHDVAYALEKEGAEVTFIKPDRYGLISARSVREALKANTKLVSVIFAQNEIGTINPIEEIGKACKEHGSALHTDAAQAVGKTPIDVKKMNIDFLSGSGHKMYGPKGVGFLYINDSHKLEPIQFGGSQERGCRPGTINVAGAVALGKASEIAKNTMNEEIKRISQMRDNFIKTIMQELPFIKLNGHPSERIYSNISLSFQGLSSEVFALGLSGLAVSTGAACSAGAPSHILSAIDLPLELSQATIRIGIGRFTRASDLEVAQQKIITMVKKNKK